MWTSGRQIRRGGASPPGQEEAEVSGFTKVAIGGAIVGLILLIVSPWLGLAVIAAAIGLPVAAYLMLDPSQRRRLRNIQRRKQIGR
jgi:hypothetical protein